MSHPSKSILLTGGNTGLGFQAALAIAKASPDWHILIASRNPANGEAAVRDLILTSGHPHVSYLRLDLAKLSSIKHFADQLALGEYPPLHAIVCNAGSQFVQETRTTDDGVEATFGVNHLGHFLLVRLLLDQLQEPGRILVVSSDTHDPRQKTGMPAPRYAAPALLSDPEASDSLLAGLPPLTRGQIRYTTSKLCNLYFAYELSRRLQTTSRSISVAAFNPGMMPGKDSSLARDYRPMLRFMWNHVLPLMRFFRPAIRSTKISGNHLAQLLLRKDIPTGSYWDGTKAIASSEESYDRDRAAELWDWSCERLDLAKEL